MAELKTKQTNASVDDFLNSVTDEQKREDSKILDKMFQKVTGDPPKMWGTSIVGYGLYHYKSKSGSEGDWMVTGFSPRKQNMTVYLMTGFAEGQFDDLLDQLGEYTVGKGCLYFKSLADVDQKVLSKIIERSVSM